MQHAQHRGHHCASVGVSASAPLIRVSASQLRLDVVDRATGSIVDQSLTFHIRVRDVNDHAPQFPKEEFSIRVQESHAAGVCSGFRGPGFPKGSPASLLGGVVLLGAWSYWGRGPTGGRGQGAGVHIARVAGPGVEPNHPGLGASL